jgi:HK97 family phage prohead protease
MDGFGAPERKFHRPEAGLTVTDGAVVEGYASLFGRRDQGGDVVQAGAYGRSLAALAAQGRRVKMLWQHDATQPIGVWDEVREDAIGLYVKGRVLTEVARGREAAALLEAGAIDGLSIGYRTVRADRDGKGQRLLQDVELWEVSLVTFPMQVEARVSAKGETPADGVWWALAREIEAARQELAGR